jgi:uncharacterized lipoprotein YmbA
MKAIVRWAAICGLVLGGATLPGCAALFGGESAPVNYYVLSAASADRATPLPSGGPIFAVASVRVPQYLSQKWIVTKTGENEIDLAENDQWGSPLSDDIASVLGENLSAMIPSDRVVQLPVSASVPVDYEVRVEIVGFERRPDGSVVLVARWAVFGDGGRRLVAMTRSGFHEGDVPDDYASITKAMSSLLAELSREIASTLQRLPATSATS